VEGEGAFQDKESHMKWLKLIAVPMLVWGNVALADLPAAGDDLLQDRQTIKSWMAHLNLYYPDLRVKTVATIDDEPSARRTLRDLESLENVLQGDPSADTGPLIHLSCSKPVCFDDGE
jgi:hypothetical protein